MGAEFPQRGKDLKQTVQLATQRLRSVGRKDIVVRGIGVILALSALSCEKQPTSGKEPSPTPVAPSISGELVTTTPSITSTPERTQQLLSCPPDSLTASQTLGGDMTRWTVDNLQLTYNSDQNSQTPDIIKAPRFSKVVDGNFTEINVAPGQEINVDEVPGGKVTVLCEFLPPANIIPTSDISSKYTPK